MTSPRQHLLKKSVTYGPRDFGGVTIYPITLATLAILEECESGLFAGSKKITLRMLNELAYIHSLPPEQAMRYEPDADHKARVAEFAATIPMEQSTAISEWLGEQITAFIQSQSRAKK